MKRKLAYFIYFLLFAIGMESELWAYTYGDLTHKNFGIFLMTSSVIILYLVPLGMLLNHFRKKFDIPKFFIPFALISGLFLAGAIASYGNGWSKDAWRMILSSSVVEDWGDALSAPFVEEFGKAFVALSTLYFFRRKDLGAGLVAGFSAGLGFQIIEDLGYISSSVVETIKSSPEDAFLRLSGSLASHWMYTTIVTVGLLLFAHFRNTDKKLARSGLYASLAIVAVHFFWNSPFSAFDSSWEIPVIQPLLTAITLMIALHVYDLVKKHQDPDFINQV